MDTESAARTAHRRTGAEKLADMMLPSTTARSVENAAAPSDAQGAPERREDHRLDQELAQDVAAAGAQGLADPDLADALGDRDQHDVHDHDPAHQRG